ncbi:hypothetical protein HDA40_002118 [Hamadaea flava]|uniref:Uncharacterized protein n=1 Tax=Hamadaea flava TaxID=1742688 RepID=A0ABV8LJL3_9ACTN|nr:hypothetical protein [Hamadaea flava]MCP2323611.1 hypothetical protein [Hamadaea flava]
MRNARKARIRSTAHPATGQPPSIHAPAELGLRRAWYLPDSAAGDNPSGEDLQGLADSVFGSAAVAGEDAATAAIRLAAACVNHLTARLSSGDCPLTPNLLSELLTGLNLVQGHIVQSAEHIARHIRHRAHPASSLMPAATTELLADMLIAAADRGQLAAAHLNEAHLLLNVG